jgi:hypothetical protein
VLQPVSLPDLRVFCSGSSWSLRSIGANRAGRQRNQHVVDNRVADLELKAALQLQPAEDLACFSEHRPRGQEDPSGLMLA